MKRNKKEVKRGDETRRDEEESGRSQSREKGRDRTTTPATKPTNNQTTKPNPKKNATHETGIKTNNKLIQLLFARFTKDVFHPGCRLIFFSGVKRPVVIRLTTLEGFLCG
jgi:hypothetical protein